MNKTILMLAGLAVFSVGAYCSCHLFAQNPPASTQPQVAGTRVAVVNVGLVFNEYRRAQAFKRELEELIKPYKTKGKVLADEMKLWHDEMQKPDFPPTKKEQYEVGIRGNKRKLEDLNLEIQKLVGKKQEDNLMTLWKEVNMGVEAVAKTYGFQVVLAYGDPIEKELLHQFPNVNRKMHAMDLGATVPLYVHASVDLSPIVAKTLNDWTSGGK